MASISVQTKKFSDLETTTTASDNSLLLIHDGSGVKTISVADFNKAVQDAIAALTTYESYTITEPTIDNVTFSQWSALVYRYGDIVTLRLNISVSSLPSSGAAIEYFTLPEQFRPAFDVIYNYVTQDGTPMLIRITTEGVVTIANTTASSSISWLCRQNITYIRGDVRP